MQHPHPTPSAPPALILSSAPLIARTLEHFLKGGPQTLTLQLASHPNLPEFSPGALPPAAVVAPQTWEEMNRWLPPLKQRFARCPWLVLAHLRIAGLFLSELETVQCTIVGHLATPEEVREAFSELIQGRSLCPPIALLPRITQGLPILPGGQRTPLLTRREFQCACGVSLGLTNRQIAAILSTGEEAVKKHVNSALRKFHLTRRQELGTLVERALFPTFGEQKMDL